MGLKEKLPPQIETALYRIIQEALNNIAKHAQADHVEVSLVQRDLRILASIQDNGRGFELEKILHPEAPERGFGIIGIQERVSLLGGQINIKSRPGFGTSIHIEIPYENVGDNHGKNTGPTG